MSKVFKTQTYYEFGYRAADGVDWWPYEHNGGYYIPVNNEWGIPAIDWVGNRDAEAIRDILDARGHDHWPVLMRKIETTYYEAEEMA